MKKITGYKDIQKVHGEKTEGKKNGFHLPQCPIKIYNKEFLSREETSGEYVELLAKNSRLEWLSSEKTTTTTMYNGTAQERSEMYRDPKPHNSFNKLYFHSRGERSTFFIKGEKKEEERFGWDLSKHIELLTRPVDTHSLFQKCWKTGFIPSVCKKSIIMPIF